jgi:hypothetical protein
MLLSKGVWREIRVFVALTGVLMGQLLLVRMGVHLSVLVALWHQTILRDLSLVSIAL